LRPLLLLSGGQVENGFLAITLQRLFNSNWRAAISKARPI
jgi:hypothetical protein